MEKMDLSMKFLRLRTMREVYGIEAQRLFIELGSCVRVRVAIERQLESSIQTEIFPK